MSKRTSSAILMSLCSLSAAAQKEATVQLGKFDIKPVLTTDVIHIDNVTYASEKDDEQASWLTVISPQINGYTTVSGHELSLGYRLERGDYHSSQADNYTDHFANLKGSYTINDRHRLAGKLTHEAGHDERGRRYSNGFGNALTTVDTYKNNAISSTYSYGAASSFAKVDLLAAFETLDYDNDSEMYLIRDRSATKVGATFTYRLFDGTNLVVDADRSDINYDNAPSPQRSLDSTEHRVLAGFAWNVNGATDSFAKLGYKEKAFDASGRDDFSGMAWEVGMRWLPLRYSQFTFTTKQDTRETNSEADYIRSRDYAATWEHHWLDRLSTTTTLAFMDDEYVGEAENLRNDEATKVTVQADYSFRRWLTLGLYYSLSERDSNRAEIEYDRSVYGLMAKVTL